MIEYPFAKIEKNKTI